MPPISQEIGIDMTAVTGMTQDSRAVKQGYLFAALKGGQADGREFISDALEKGASYVLTDREAKSDSDKVKCRDNPRRDFAHLTAEYYGQQPQTIVAVTGTNGKSSVVHFVNGLWQALDKKSAFIGTLSGAMTTPDPVRLHTVLKEMAGKGVTHAAMEASSHGLVQYRMDGVRLSVAAFTSFSQDHLDFHDSMEEYLGAKARLFGEVLPLRGVAVLNADIPAYDVLSAVCKRRGLKTITYGKKGRDLRLNFREIDGVMQDISVDIFGETYAMRVPFVGAFQVMNVLCALACVLAHAADDEDIIAAAVDAVQGLSAVPGRLQHVGSSDERFHAYVDYAHTPDALENVLTALRHHTAGRLICVFGCGGDRDNAKRPMMGEVAARLADCVIVTDDNPRSEDPENIRKQILSGIKNPQADIHEVGGRKAAIEAAIKEMEEDDIVLIAGKGHEQGQIFKGKTEPFDDVSEVRKALTAYKL